MKKSQNRNAYQSISEIIIIRMGMVQRTEENDVFYRKTGAAYEKATRVSK
jgi:hypothetical protein